MKTLKITSLIAITFFISSSLNAKASSPFIDAFIMDTPAKSIIQVDVDKSVDAYIYISDDKGKLMYSDRVDSESGSAKFFDFSNLQNGNYTIYSESDYLNLTKTVSVSNSNVEIIKKETEFKPFFKIEEDKLKVSYLNLDMNDVELTIEKSSNVLFEAKKDDKISYHKILNISTLLSGEYYAKLEAGGKEFYYHFNVN